MKNEIVAIIPARGGSKGLPGKNIKEIGGMPLIAHTILAAKASKLISRTIVTTDDQEIARLARAYGAEVPFLRPAELASDTAKAPDVVIHCLQWLSDAEGEMPELTVLLQCTSPLRTGEHIDEAIELFRHSGCDSLTSVCEAEHSPMWMFTKSSDILSPIMEDFNKYSQRQAIPKFYRQNGAIYIAKSKDIVQERALEFGTLIGYEMSSKSSVDIDTELDFALAKLLIEERAE